MARRSNDKETRSHIETLYYAPACMKPGDSISHSALDDREHAPHWHRGGRCDAGRMPCTVITATECGDYSGNALVGESNFRVMQESYPWLVEIYGSHGYRALAYLGKRENQSDELIEAIDSLASYPILDESDHSELELEKESEAWESDGARNFRRALAPILDALDTRACTTVACTGSCMTCDDNGRIPFERDADLISDDDLYELWRDGCDSYNVNGGSGYVNEQGDSIHFYIREWIEGYEREPMRVPYGRDKEPFQDRLKTLAIVSRVVHVDPAVLLVARDAWLEDPDSDETITLLNTRVSPDFHAALLYAWEQEQNQPEETP